jgi:hypothetical protein
VIHKDGLAEWDHISHLMGSLKPAQHRTPSLLLPLPDLPVPELSVGYKTYLL